MNLEEAIKHLEATLEDSTHIWSCENCKEEHKQLLTWLLELRSLRAQQEENKSNALLAQYAAQKFQESMTDFKEIQRLKTQLAALWNMEKNDPLTLDALREMDGEPVWVVVNTGIDPLSFWALVEVCEESIFLTNNLGGRTEYAADVEFEEDCITVYHCKP